MLPPDPYQWLLLAGLAVVVVGGSFYSRWRDRQDQPPSRVERLAAVVLPAIVIALLLWSRRDAPEFWPLAGLYALAVIVGAFFALSHKSRS